MLNQKMIDVMNDVAVEVAERDELIECIAVALLSKRNLFILGDTGQAKSYCINEFRRRITGARQFERLLSKQADEEQLFGRLDLSSLIPGSVPNDELRKDIPYSVLYNKLKKLYEEYTINDKEDTLKEALETSETMEKLKKVLYMLGGSNPKMITHGKIPDSHIVFIDEIFKANDGILNSLLTALNERVYTNEGQTVKIPVISFFSASNEIPNFKEPEQQILKPLYDRFDLKVLTHYVEERQNRLDVLKKKQVKKAGTVSISTITIEELVQMQHEVQNIKIPDVINELMDDIVYALRVEGIHVSDRKLFNYYPLVQAKAYLRGGQEVSPNDLMVLKNYLWCVPEEITVVEQKLTDMCQNPVHSKIVDLITMAEESFDSFGDNSDNAKAFVKIRSELLKLYDTVCSLQAVTTNDAQEIEAAKEQLEKISRQVYDTKGYTVVPLSEAREQQI